MATISDSMRAAWRETWEKIPHVVTSEEWGRLYYARFGRLRPGKDDVHRDSMDEENRRQYQEWHESGLAALDAIVDLAFRREQSDRRGELLSEAAEWLNSYRETRPSDVALMQIVERIDAEISQ